MMEKSGTNGGTGFGYFYEDLGRMFGDDTIHAGKGDDSVWAGAGDDYVWGGEGVDTIFGGSGEDVIYGDEGADNIFTGAGWDVVFGGDGCDYIYSQDGGDVIWAGPCTPESAMDKQYITVYGTGEDPDNFTVLMDFWSEDAIAYNYLCLFPDPSQGMPGSGACTIMPNLAMGASCLSAADLQAGRSPNDMVARTRGGGCKNDQGPLWVTVQLQDDEEVGGSNGGGDVPRTVWARIFQKK